MADSLAASFFSSNKDRNLAIPGDTVTFTLTSPPTAATDVLISVLETVAFLDTAKAQVTDRLIGAFRGRITRGVFQVERIIGAPLPPSPDPVLIRIAASPDPASPHLFAQMPEPEQIQAHALRLRVEGTVSGKKLTFEGTSNVQMEYPLAMIVPAIPMPHDPNFAILESWAVAQWKAHKPNFRHVEHVTALRFTRRIAPGDYDQLINAFVACARKASVVALSTGHGDGGQSRGNSVAWCNIVPEDFPVPIAPNPFLYNLDISEDGLLDGATQGRLPGGVSKVKLDALDRLSDALAGTGIRRILLHTCTVGQNKAFMQAFADRVQVPMLAQTDHVEHIGFPGKLKILAHYEGVNTVSPRDLRHWPISTVAGPFRPGPKPRRFGP